jgi:hypothetical protein
MRTELQMADLSAADQARKALHHTLCQIHDRWPVAWYLGHGTQTFALLTEALAAHSDKTVDEIREGYAPAPQRTWNSDELRDCPFCGGHYLQLKTVDFHKAVYCGDCDFAGPNSSRAVFDDDEPEEVAAAEASAREKWNHRTMPR